MTGRTHRITWVCSGVHPTEKKLSGSLIAQAFRMVVPYCLELSNARAEELVFLLGATMDEQCPACDLDGDGLFPRLHR